MAVPAWLPVAATVASMVFSAKGVSTAQQGGQIAAQGGQIALQGGELAMQGAQDAAAAARENAARRAEEAKFEAEQLRANAGQEVAAGQMGAIEQRRQAVLTQSRAIAVAAAGGGSVADPTIVNILSRNAGDGVYRAALSLYQGNERARLMRMSAAGKDYEAETDVISGDAQAKAYLLQGESARLRAQGEALNAQGAQLRSQGEADRGVAGILGNVPNLLTQGSTLFSKYGSGGPTASADSYFAGADLAVA